MKLRLNRIVYVSFVSFMLLIVWAVSGVVLMNRVDIEPSEAIAAKRTVKVLIRTGSESVGLRQIAKVFEEEFGIQVEFIELGRDVYFTSVGTQLFAGTNAFDVVFLPNTSIAQFADTKALLPLDPFINNSLYTDRLTFDVDDFLSTYPYKGATFALPTDISTHFLYYRSDLIPKPPETWDELYAIAAKFTKQRNEDSPTRWGLAMPAVVPEERSKIFSSLLWTYGGDVIEENTGQVLFDQAGSIAAGSFLNRLVQDRIVPSDMITWDFSRTRDALLSGEIAMAAPYWNSAIDMIKQSDSPYKNEIKIALIPGIRDQAGGIYRTPFQHGWMLAINANAKHPVDAWEFIKFATGKRGGSIYAQFGGVPARRSILSDPSFSSKRPDFALILESMKTAKPEPSLTYYPAMVEIENDALAKILTLHEDPRSTLLSAASKLRNLVEKVRN